MIMVRIIDAPRLIDAAGYPPKTIAEYIGREVSGTQPVSIAMMNSPPGWSEPGQVPEFDEYSVVISGTLVCTTRSGSRQIQAGQAVIAPAGSWIQYSSPEGAQYLAVCLPAFSPTLVHRDNEKPPASEDEGYPDIEYDIYGPEGLDLIENLWNQLKAHHVCNSRYFREQLQCRPYHERKIDILQTNASRTIIVHLAREKGKQEYIGFCVSSAAPGEYGEIESIYVQPEYRNRGVGTVFMTHACKFLDETGVTEYRVRVCEGNEDSFRFYERFGFYLRRHLLIRREEPKK